MYRHPDLCREVESFSLVHVSPQDAVRAVFQFLWVRVLFRSFCSLSVSPPVVLFLVVLSLFARLSALLSFLLLRFVFSRSFFPASLWEIVKSRRAEWSRVSVALQDLFSEELLLLVWQLCTLNSVSRRRARGNQAQRGRFEERTRERRRRQSLPLGKKEAKRRGKSSMGQRMLAPVTSKQALWLFDRTFPSLSFQPRLFLLLFSAVLLAFLQNFLRYVCHRRGAYALLVPLLSILLDASRSIHHQSLPSSLQQASSSKQHAEEEEEDRAGRPATRGCDSSAKSGTNSSGGDNSSSASAPRAQQEASTQASTQSGGSSPTPSSSSSTADAASALSRIGLLHMCSFILLVLSSGRSPSPVG